MSGFKGKICIFFVAMVCVVAFGVPRARSDNPIYNLILNTNGGNVNPDYLGKICQMRNVGFSRPNADSTCPTTTASYSTTFSLSSSPTDEFPQKYANHVDATDGYETFLGYNHASTPTGLDYINANGQLMITNVNSYSGNRGFYAWWGGVVGVTPFNVKYYGDSTGATLVDTKSCTFGVNAGCDVLSPVGITPPAGKYFDGWFCRSNGHHNCRANRYLPSNYASLSTPITPLGSSAITNWPNTQMFITASTNDLRDANGDIVTNMSYEYTGQNTINLYAAWAPYNVTFQCQPFASSPYVGSATRTTSTYLDENNVVHDIVYGVDIPLAQNITNLCKSVYYEYDVAHGNDQWAPEYLNDLTGTGIYSNVATNYLMGESGSATNTEVARIRQGQDVTINVRASSLPSFTVLYNCGSFDGVPVSGASPNQQYILMSNGTISRPTRGEGIEFRAYPRPALPYRQTNGEYLACSTFTLTPTSGTGAGVPQEVEDVQIGTVTDAGYGCCHKPQYAEFKGYQVRRNTSTGEILNNGELIQPGQFGSANCNVSFNNNTDPDTWTPGCDLWPWAGRTYLTAIWEHTPIQVTFNHNGADNTANLLSTAYLKYGEGFYLYSTSSGYSGQITQMSPLPQKTGYTFGGYQYCDANDNCTMVVDSQGNFISGENNLKFTDVDITVSAVWGQTYTATYSCGTGTTGTAPTNDTVTYGTTPTLPSVAGSCAKAGYTLSGWRVDGESSNWVNGTSVWNFASDKNLTAQWTLNSYTMQYVCSDGSDTNPASGWTFGGTAPTATNPVSYNQNVTMAADPYSDQNGCRKIYGTQGNADYCDDCFTFGGWTIDAESVALEVPDLVHTANSTVSWGNTNGTNWCIVNTSGLCDQYSANDTFLVRAQYTPKQYDITYMYATSPSSPNASMPAEYTYSVGTPITNADQTAPAHATFNGWCTDLNDATTCVTAGQPITIGNRDHGDRTYYAKWSCDSGYDLSYNANNEPVCSAIAITCSAGYYLAAGDTTCSECIAGNYCPGGTFNYDATNDQGINICTNATYSGAGAAVCTDCPTGYTYNTTPGKTSISQCQIHCNAGTYVADADYTRLEYIQSSGSQYINTGIKSVVNTEFNLDAQLTSLSDGSGASATMLGALDGTTNGQKDFKLVLAQNNNGRFQTQCAHYGNYLITTVPVDTQRHTFQITNTANSQTVVIDNGTPEVGSYAVTSKANTDLYLFARNADGTPNNYVSMRVYSLDISQNGTPVRKFIPARRNSDNAVGMYDLVNNVFYTNDGTGTFSAGPDVVVMSGQCVNVGAGYYSTGETVNYGSSGARTACAIGTYSDIPNASSCTLCQNATYSDAPAAATCTPCPTGYTYNTTPGKTSVNQCQIHCNAGTYVASLSEYTELEYIENTTGTAYIDTGVSHSSGVIKGELKIGTPTALTGNINILGTQRSDAQGYSVGWQNGFKIWIDVGSIKKTGPNHALSAGATHELTYEFNNGNLTLTYDNRNTTGTYTDLGTPNTIHLFTGGYYLSDREFKGRLHYYKLYENNVLVHEFVPARRNSDNALGIYDKIKHVFIAATGTMTAGPDVGTLGGQCVNVGFGYWAPASTVNFGSTGVRNACPVGTTTSTETAASESACEIDSKFTIVTTNMTANDTFKFHICSIGNFVVDWGDGSTLEVVAQNGTGPRGYTHTYTDAGVHRIRVGGIATQYDANTTDGIKNPAIFFYNQNVHNGTPTKIASIEGSIGAVFPTLGNELNQIPIFYRTFDGATNMTTIPSTLFSGATGARSDMFGSAFKGCSKLTTIPSGLFSGISGAGQRMFASTFEGCSSINAIPSGLFSGVNGSAANMFDSAFEGCSGITAIPSGLFDGVTGYAESMFIDTFYNCSKLTTIPSGLFRNVSGGATSMFQYTFGFCPKLEAIPSGLFDSVTTAADSMFAATFYGDTAIQQIPSGLFRNLSGGASSMFWATFAGCTGLTGPIPANLFNGITTAAQNQFYATFWGATNLSGYVPSTLFSGLNGATATGMMDFVFLDTNLYEECPCGTHQYITGYEDDWSNKVSCEVGVKPNEVWYNNQCTTLCQSGVTHLKTSNGINVALLTDKLTSPALNVKYNDAICYVPLESNVGNGAINIKVGNTNYHTVAASQTPPANFGL